MMPQIVWSEGMFIAPQHFQHADAAVRAYVNEVAQLDLSDGDDGVSALEINGDALNLGKVAARAAAGIFPDRTFFRLSKEVVIDIPDGTVDEVVYLALPLAIHGSAQFGGPGAKTRMVSTRAELRDVTDPANEPIEADLAEAGVTLLLGSEDQAGFTVTPIARILEKSADGRVVLDKRFIPKSVRIGAAAILMERLEEIISLARLRANNAAGRVATQTDTRSETSLLTERLELQTLNRWLVVLQNAAATGTAAPRRLYEWLACLSVELDASAARSADAGLIYDPLSAVDCFERVINDLRRKLTLERPANVVEFQWNAELFERRRLLRLVIPARVLAEGRRPVLALSGPDGTARLLAAGPLSCKLAALTAMPDLVARGLPGVPLRPLNTAPSELRSRADAAFFAVDTGDDLWKSFLDKREALALHIDDRIQSVEATLYLLE